MNAPGTLLDTAVVAVSYATALTTLYKLFKESIIYYGAEYLLS